ncbi:MAG: PKD domain-containing protein [Bacteroidales bacterium]|nr:PKD domain-containing protein [Bacteroidales bacterium]
MNKRNISFSAIFMMVFCPGCYKNEPIPVAGFNYSGTNHFTIPCTVTFNNTSTNAFSYLWKFGDDSISVLTHPSHTYKRPGKYDIYLRAYTESQREWTSLIKTIIIKDTVK